MKVRMNCHFHFSVGRYQEEFANISVTMFSIRVVVTGKF